MGMLDGRWEKADEALRAVIDPLVVDGEEVLGRLHATAKSAFSATVYAIGVTPQRLVLVPLDRKMARKGDPVTIRPNDIVRSSVDGFGGGLAHFVTSDPGEIRIETADGKYKLMAVGGVIAGDAQHAGKRALLEFLYEARNPQH